MTEKKIFRNRARCRQCGDVIESKHLRDHVRCGCGLIELDGGTEVPRLIGAQLEDFLEHPLAIKHLERLRQQKYDEMREQTYGVAKRIEPSQAHQLALDAETEEEQKFWRYIEEMRLRQIRSGNYD